MPDDNIHSLRSSHREALLEHLFAGEIMRRLWIRGEWRLEVLKRKVDDGRVSKTVARRSRQRFRGCKGCEGEWTHHTGDPQRAVGEGCA